MTANTDKQQTLLQNAGTIANIALALLALVAALVATIHFTIKGDVNPQFYALDIRLERFEQKTDRQFEKVDQQFENVNQRLKNIEKLLSKQTAGGKS